MMLIEPEQQDVGIVLIGDFNPPIFSPAWLRQHEIVGEKAAFESTISIIHPDLSQFTVGDIEVLVERQRFQLLVRSAPFVQILDVVSKAFGEFLPHTPIRQFGINRSIHFTVESQRVRTGIGRKLAPLEPWGDWGAEISEGSGELEGGMVNVSMMERHIVDKFRLSITASVQPSIVIPHNSGIFVAVNHHHEPIERSISQKALLQTLEGSFGPSLEKSLWIIEKVMALKDTIDVDR
jgi:hypothetical protein